MAYTVGVQTTFPKNIGLTVKQIGDVVDSNNKLSRKNIYQKLLRYPPRPPGSTYQRTGRLRRSWQIIERQEAIVSRGVRYASYVQSKRDQAGIHQGRWTTEAKEAEREMPNYRKNVKKGFRRLGAKQRPLRKVRTSFTVIE